MRTHVGLLIAVAAAVAAACGGSTSVSSSSGASGSSGAADDAGAACDTEPCEDPTADSGTELDTPTVCTSGTTWTRGDRGSASMHPGVACIACHAANRAPLFTIAGTVYPSAHEPDNCNGATGVTVVITDKNGKVTKIPVNSAGNFYSTASVATPFQAKVVKGTSERVMVAAQTTGDCNSCHTVNGMSSAPGRIVAPP